LAVPELDLTTAAVIAPVSVLVCPVVKTGARPSSEMATKPVALRLFQTGANTPETSVSCPYRFA